MISLFGKPKKSYIKMIKEDYKWNFLWKVKNDKNENLENLLKSFKDQ